MKIRGLLSHFKEFRKEILPPSTEWRGAGFGVLLLLLVMAVLTAVPLVGNGWEVYTLLYVILGLWLLAFLSASLVDLAALILKRMPVFYRWTMAGFLTVGVTMLFTYRNLLHSLILTLLLLVFASLMGAGIWIVFRKGFRAASPVKRGLVIAYTIIGAVGLAGSGIWYLWDGPGQNDIPNAVSASGESPFTVTESDPSLPGSYQVKTLTYGSGKDIRRVKYGTEVALITPSVDGSPFIDNWSGLAGDLRSAYWGFSARELPLNGTVWYPEGAGSFPLVLIVHGNHHFMDFSEDGYAYLCELLASRGSICASIDENFLNSSWTDIELFGIKGLGEENDARGWLLLEHLTVWKKWARESGNPFTGKVDLNRVLLVGHSRGGEAAAIAAAFNRLDVYPDDASIRFDYNFGVQGVAAIAPIDGQYFPSDVSLPLMDMNYLVLHGYLDGDVDSFSGLKMYNRLAFSGDGDWFKSAVYIVGANHGQFNTSWGKYDTGRFPKDGLLNLGDLLPAEQQRKAASIAISGFTETILHNRPGYRLLFRDPRLITHWMPELWIQTRYDDSGGRIIADFQEDIDLRRGTLAGSTITTQGLTHWRESNIAMRMGDMNTKGVYLGWDNASTGTTGQYRIHLQPGGFSAGNDSTIYFSMADAHEDPNPSSGGGIQGAIMDLTLVLVDAAGAEARVPLSRFLRLQPRIPFQLHKAAFLDGEALHGEPIFQSFEYPISLFSYANPQFDPTSLREIRFVFDRTPRGMIILDEVGIRE